MKAHRRSAKNCALIECCQVAAEKANWQLSDWARQQNSLTGGGGERARLPEFTATDAHGRVEGMQSGGYASRISDQPAQAPAVAPPRSQPRLSLHARRSLIKLTSKGRNPTCRHRHRLRTAAAAETAPCSNPVFVDLRLEEALIWPDTAARDLPASIIPIGMNLGGDPSQALVHSNPDGKFMVALSSIDLGQGMKSVTAQIAAETLGVPIEDVYVDTADSDTGRIAWARLHRAVRIGSAMP